VRCDWCGKVVPEVEIQRDGRGFDLCLACRDAVGRKTGPARNFACVECGEQVQLVGMVKDGPTRTFHAPCWEKWVDRLAEERTETRGDEGGNDD
jgi:hypothetical protein